MSLFSRFGHPTSAPEHWLRLRFLLGLTAGLAGLLIVLWGLKRSGEHRVSFPRYPLIWTHFSPGPTLWVREADGPPRPLRLLGLADADPAPWQDWLTKQGPPQVQVVPDDRHQQPGQPPWALVYLPDGRLLNEELLKNGLATPHPAQRHDLEEWFSRVHRRPATPVPPTTPTTPATPTSPADLR